MKRKALLIGNSNGLAGVKLDISNYTNFLMGDLGGQWYDSEIVIKMNPTRNDLLATIQNLRVENLDFVFAAFSGHGAFCKSTILEINKDEEYIYETELIGISKRQISIFDCCRNVIPKESLELRKAIATFSLAESKKNIRIQYEVRIMQAIEQQIQLYACSINESSLDTSEGGLYSKTLIGSATPSNRFKLVGETHEEAAGKTTSSAWVNHSHRQHPTATIPRCLASQQLIFSINPNSAIL
jgi:hypothetical protein